VDRDSIFKDPAHGNKAEAFEAFDDIPTNPNVGHTIGDVINHRYGRRDVMRGILGVSATTALFSTSAMTAPKQASAMGATDSRYKFDELAWGNDEDMHIADGYNADILLRWGDPIAADAPDFDPYNQTAEAQLRQFGYNSDYVGFAALNAEGTNGHSKLFFHCPVGGELCGPYFTDDSQTLFLVVQHPGTDGTKDLVGFERGSTFEDPATRWPDFAAGIPPRPSVVAATKKGCGPIAV